MGMWVEHLVHAPVGQASYWAGPQHYTAYKDVWYTLENTVQAKALG